jgi:microcystin-dependent protein
VTTATFNQPAVGANGNVSVVNSSWITVGQTIYIGGGGFYSLVSAPNLQSITVQNLGYPGNAAPAAVVNSNAGVSAAGIQGPSGGPIPTGTVLDFGGPSAPSGFVMCDGTSYATVGTYAALFAVIGYTFGGSGANFNVPDCRSRMALGAGPGLGLTNRALAATGGGESHVLALAEMPSHNHTATQATHTHTDSGHTHSDSGHTHPVQNRFAAAFGSGSSGGVLADTFAFNTGTGYANIQNGYANLSSIAPTITVANAGSGSAMTIMNPFVVLNKIIKT